MLLHLENSCSCGKGDEVVTYLKKRKVKTLNAVVSTHPDVDHVGGLSEVFSKLTVKSVKTYSKSDLNVWSAVLQFTHNKKNFLFTGDAETQAENDMLKAWCAF